jgi:hypothetical protein
MHNVGRLVRVSFALRYDAVASSSFADKNDYWPAMTAKTKATNDET